MSNKQKTAFIVYKVNQLNNDLQYIKEYYTLQDIKKDYNIKNIRSLYHYIIKSADQTIKQLLKNDYIIIREKL